MKQRPFNRTTYHPSDEPHRETFEAGMNHRRMKSYKDKIADKKYNKEYEAWLDEYIIKEGENLRGMI